MTAIFKLIVCFAQLDVTFFCFLTVFVLGSLSLSLCVCSIFSLSFYGSIKSVIKIAKLCQCGLFCEAFGIGR